MTPLKKNNQITRESLLQLLNEGLRQTNISVNSLEIAAGLTQGTIKDFTRGKTEILRADKLQSILNVFKELGANLVAPWQVADGVKQVPILGTVPGGALLDVQQQHAVEYIPYPTKRRNVGAVQVRGNSVNRLAPDGAYAIVDFNRTDPATLAGELVIVSINRGGIWETTCKMYRRSPDRFEPYSTEHHDTIFPGHDEWKICGLVIGAIGYLGRGGKLLSAPIIEFDGDYHVIAEE